LIVMENATQKKINYILFALLLLNISITCYLVYRNQTSAPSTESISFEKDEGLRKLVEKAVFEYNNKNFIAVYNLFDDQAKIQMSDVETSKSFESLSKFSGRIADYVYTSSEKAGFKSGKNFYTVKYHAKFEGGTFEKGRGELKVTFTDSGAEKKLYFFGLNANLSK
jgi:hypothetical protein